MVTSSAEVSVEAWSWATRPVEYADSMDEHSVRSKTCGTLRFCSTSLSQTQPNALANHRLVILRVHSSSLLIEIGCQPILVKTEFGTV